MAEPELRGSAIEDELARAVPGVVAKLAMTLLWLLASAIPLLVLWGCDVSMSASWGFDCGWYLLPLLWAVCAGWTSRLYLRALGRVDEVTASPPPARALHHLPVACARMVEEAAAIRQDLGDVEAALLRAWVLANEVEQAPGEARMVLEASGATLAPVHGLVAARAEGRRRVSKVRQREQLTRALASFEDALARPRAGGFR